MTADESRGCCHLSALQHLTEAALLATLLVEHDAISRSLADRARPAEKAAADVDLIAAHRAAATALTAWEAASNISDHGEPQE